MPLLPALALLFLAGALIVGALLGRPHWRAWRRRHIAARPFPAAWRTILRRRVPIYARLPPMLQQRVRAHIQVFLAEQRFIGCAGQAITDDVRVTIAAQAALLRLGHTRGHFYDELRQVLVYPGAFIVDRLSPRPGGALAAERHALAGESWQQGQVILSWQDVVEGAANPDDGRNVALHEFAHQLDQATGVANGTPHLDGRARYQRWAQVMQAEYAALQGRLAAAEAAAQAQARARADALAGEGAWAPVQAWAATRPARPELIGAYAAQNPAEFFAVVTERFFEQPAALAAWHPALYGELQAYYGVDPQAW